MSSLKEQFNKINIGFQLRIFVIYVGQIISAFIVLIPCVTIEIESRFKELSFLEDLVCCNKRHGTHFQPHQMCKQLVFFRYFMTLSFASNLHMMISPTFWKYKQTFKIFLCWRVALATTFSHVSKMSTPSQFSREVGLSVGLISDWSEKQCRVPMPTSQPSRPRLMFFSPLFCAKLQTGVRSGFSPNLLPPQHSSSSHLLS